MSLAVNAITVLTIDDILKPLVPKKLYNIMNLPGSVSKKQDVPFMVNTFPVWCNGQN